MRVVDQISSLLRPFPVAPLTKLTNISRMEKEKKTHNISKWNRNREKCLGTQNVRSNIFKSRWKKLRICAPSFRMHKSISLIVACEMLRDLISNSLTCFVCCQWAFSSSSIRCMFDMPENWKRIDFSSDSEQGKDLFTLLFWELNANNALSHSLLISLPCV